MKKFYTFLLIVNIILVNLAISYLLFAHFKGDRGEAVTTPTIDLKEYISEEEDLVVQSGCDEECRTYVDERVSALESMISDVSNILTNDNPVVAPTSVITKKIKTVTYFPISGSGSTLSTNWVDVSGTDFYLSKSDYPGLVGIYFEANMKLANGNGEAYLRIYDVTHGIAVSGSEISTSNQISTFVTSGNLNFWSGYNNYRVQAKSLTADTTVFESGRLKIISEN